MELKEKTKIRTLIDKIKKDFRDDYFKLTFFYLALYAIYSIIGVCIINYFINGSFELGDKGEIITIIITFMNTMATMAGKLKDDIVSNYWKLSKRRNHKNKS
jgi:hypothetical protein